MPRPYNILVDWTPSDFGVIDDLAVRECLVSAMQPVKWARQHAWLCQMNPSLSDEEVTERYFDDPDAWKDIVEYIRDDIVPAMDSATLLAKLAAAAE